MTDSRMNRTKGILAVTPTSGLAGTPIGSPPVGHSEPHADAGTPHQALLVLTLAQRTADEHLAKAHQEAERIRAGAQAAAEHIAQEARGHADNVRQDANKMLSDAREAAAETAREAEHHAADARRNADKILTDAQSKAESVAAEAQNNAEELKLQAEQRYQDVVGTLAAKRNALQQQIEALEEFDREYRARLTSFMQGQMRALWVDQPQVTGHLEPSNAEPAYAEPAGNPPPAEGR